MVYRNRSKDYFKHRERLRIGAPGARLPPQSFLGGHTETETKDDDGVGITVRLRTPLPPEWVDLVEAIQRDIKELKGQIRQLQQLHSRRLQVSFNEQTAAKQEQEITLASTSISRLLHENELNIKRIATVASDHLAKEEKAVRLNAMRSLGSQVQALSKTFRLCQKEFMSNLRGQDQVGNEFFADSTDSVFEEKSDLSGGLGAEAMQQEFASENDQEVRRTAQSINELATLFKELNVLVIDQGTVLDRIDYNVEQALVKVTDGREQLEKAEKSSRKASTIKMILILIAINILLTVILVWKHSS